MADFKTALIALSNDEIAYELIERNIGNILNRNPALAIDILEQLQDAFNAGIIETEHFAQLKSYVTQLSARENPEITIAHEARQAIAPGGEIGHALDFDLGPITENPERQQHSTDTSWPSDKERQPKPPKSGKIDSGTVIRGRFQLDKVLGVGGMGTVFRGRDLIKVEARDKNPYVALKILNEDFKDHPDAFIALQREASRQQKLAHPNITTVHDFDRTEDGTFYLTMELLEGQPLNRFIKKVVKPQRGLPFDQAFPMIEGLANALIYAHEHEIVHSDFKPGNCFITTDGTMKVLDFGIARAVKTPGSSDTEKTVFDPGKLGALTPPYASVEMLEEQEPDTRDDIYALACVAYELLTGKHPFNKLRATTARDNNLVPMPIKGLKKHQIQALNHGLGFSRSERSQTVREFLEELRGKPSRFGNPWITVPSVAVILAAVGVFPMIGLMQERETDRLVQSLRSGDPLQINETLTLLRRPEFDAALRDRVLVASRGEILTHYDTKIAEKINVSTDNIDLARARELISEIGSFAVFSDSTQVAAWRERLMNVESDLLNQKSAEFNEALIGDRLLDLDGQNDVHDILLAAQKIDAELAQNFRLRLPGAYAAAIQRAIVNEEFERAVSLSQAGLKLFPEQAFLINLSQKIAAAQERVQHRKELQQTTIRIRDAVDVATGLADFSSVQQDIQLYAFFEPQSPILDELRSIVAQFAAVETDAQADNTTTGNTLTDLNDYGLLFRTLNLKSIEQKHRQRLSNTEAELQELFTQVRGQILDPNMTIHSQDVADSINQLNSFSGQHKLHDNVLNMVARWALGGARRARSLGNFEAAQSDLDKISNILNNRIPLPDISDERQIITALANNNAVHYVQNSDAQRAQFERQSAELEQSLQSVPTTVEALAEVLDGYDALAATDPVSTRLSKFRNQLIEQTHRATQITEDNGNSKLTADLLAKLLVYFPDDTSSWDMLDELRKKIVRDENKMAADEAMTLKDELAELLAKPSSERTWNHRVQQLFLQLQRSSEVDEQWLESSRAKIAETIMGTANDAMEAEKFAEASILLWRVTPYVSQQNKLIEQQQKLERIEREFVIQHRIRERDARVAGLKRDFDTQVAALDISNATKTFLALQQEPTNDDGFFNTQAEVSLAAAYLEVANQAISTDDHASALDILKAGANTLPNDTNIRAAIERSRVKGNSQELTRTFATGGNFDIAAALDRIEEIETSDPDFFNRRQTNWALAIGKRLNGLARSSNTDSPEFTQIVNRAKQIFVDDPVIQQLSFAVTQRAPATILANNIAEAQANGHLSHARQLIGELGTEQRETSEFAALIIQQQAMTSRAREHFTQYKLALDNDNTALAREELRLALTAWRDNRTFIEEIRRWVDVAYSRQ